MQKRPAICPDCRENPATNHDGSGWFCDECKEYAARITAVIEQNIMERRLKDPAHRAETRRRSWRAWYHKNKKRLKKYHQTYNKLYGRGLRDYGLREALQQEMAA